MLRRIAALLLVLLMAGQALAGAVVCGIDALHNKFDGSSEMSYPMQGEGECAEMACCALGKSPIGSVAAMVCCELICGESTGGAQFNFTPPLLLLAPPVITHRASTPHSLSAESANAFSVFLKSADNALLAQDPPDLFLANSTFLI
jgi:hypothetical protein